MTEDTTTNGTGTRLNPYYDITDSYSDSDDLKEYISERIKQSYVHWRRLLGWVVGLVMIMGDWVFVCKYLETRKPVQWTKAVSRVVTKTFRHIRLAKNRGLHWDRTRR